MKRNLPSCALLVLALCLVQCHPPSYHSPQKAAGAQEMIVLQDESPVDVIRARTAPDPTEMEPADLHGEGYLEIVENDFQNALDHPHSTFAIDVDNASYSNIRRLLTSGYPPPIDAVRIEEMINYFNYDYPEPEGEDPFAVSAEVATCPWNPQHRLLQIGIQGRKIPTTHLPPNNLVFLIDASGSMQSPEKLPLLQSALRMLVREMRPQDRVAIVVYAGASGLVLPSTPAAQKGRILSAINALQAGGGTAGAAGIQLAYKVARENWLSRGNNRVILATDGDFNIGVQSTAELVRLIESQRQSGVYLSVLGFGRGNLQDGKMEQLAKHGNGNYAYIDRLAEAEKVLIREMSGTLLTIAKNVKLQLEFNPTQVREYRLIGYENRLLAAEDFNDDRRDAGELGAGHSVTALYEIVPASNPPPAKTSPVDPLKYRSTQLLPEALRGDLLTLKLRYQRPGTEQSKGLEYVVVDKGLALEHSSTDFRFAAAVAGFGLLLRHSPHRGEASWAMVSDLARSGLGPDPYDLRHEFLTLVQLASDQGVAAPYRDGRRLKAAN